LQKSINLMKLVVDTNIIMSALINDSLTRRLIFNPGFQLFLPDFSLEEIEKYSQEIGEKSQMTKEDFNQLLELILLNFSIIKKEKYHTFLGKAEEICKDEKDAAFLALALYLNLPLWSNDKQIKNQSSVKVYSTEEIIGILDINQG